MEILKIVLTGGPCAGKTTMLKEITGYLNKKGIANIIVPETATELIKSGILPGNTDESANLFQDLLMKKQLFKEKLSDSYLKGNFKNSDKVVAICDRGVIDGKAYLKTSEAFSNLLHNNSLTEIEVLDSYDLVLDLITTADCNRGVYNNLNEARFETADEAVIVDRKTSNAWAGHRNIKIINTSISLEEETNIILNYIANLIYNQETKKVNNYLVDLSNFKNRKQIVKILVENYYLESQINGYNYILTKRNYNGGASYLISNQKRENGKIFTIASKAINAHDFYNLLDKSNVIKKEVYEEASFIKDRQLYRFKIYDDISIMEIEKNELNKSFVFPDDVNVLKYDVTEEEIDEILNKNKKVYTR